MEPFTASPMVNSSIICFTDSDCANAGACTNAATLNATCQCFRGYWGSLCERGLYELQGPLVVVHHVLFLAVFFTLAVFAAINTICAIILTRRTSGKTIDSMVAILFSIVFFGCIERVFYLAVDPYWMYRVLPIWLENILYGLGIWALIAVGIIVVTSWVVVYNKMNPKAPIKWFRWIGFGSIFILFCLSVGTDAARYYSTAAQRNIYGWVYRIALIVFALGFSCWFLWYGRRMYKTLDMFKQNSVNLRLMKKIYFVARSTAIFTVVFVFIQIFSNVATIVFVSPHTFLPYQFLFRLQEVGYFIIILRTFNFHSQWKHVFKPVSARSTAATASRTKSPPTSRINTSTGSSGSKSSSRDNESSFTSMTL